MVESMEPVRCSDMHYVMSASVGKYLQIEKQYQSEDQRKEALIAHTLSTHPCLSWNVIADGLQKMGYGEASAEVTRKYVKGQSVHRAA